MKKLLYALFFTLTICAIAGLSYAYFVVIPKEVENRILTNFTNLGFETFWFEGIEHKNGKVIISNITLDKDGFSSIERVDVTFSLWRFLLSPDSAQNVTITGLSLSGTLSDNMDIQLSGMPDYKTFLEKLPNTPAHMINIERSDANLLSDTFGGIKVEYNGQINLRDLSKITINGTASSRQHKVSFHSKIKGHIDDKQNIDLTAETEQIEILSNDVSLKRGSAIISMKYSLRDHALHTHADFHVANLNWRDLPLNRLKGAYDINNTTQKIFIEGQTSGLNAIKWTADITHAQQKKTNATISITPDNVMDVIEYLKQNKIIDKDEHFPDNFKMMDKPIIQIDATENKNGTYDGKFQAFLNAPDVVVHGLFNQDKNNKTKGSFYVSKTNIFPSGKKSQQDHTSYLEISSSGMFEHELQSPVNALSWSLKTQVHDGKIDFGAFAIPQVSGLFSHTPKHQNARLTLPFKLNLKNSIEQKGSININTNDKNAPILGAANLSIYGGSIETKDPVIKKSGEIQDVFSLSVSDINISQLFKDAGFKDVAVYGYMGGLIPLKIGANDVDVNGGILQSQGGGVVNMSEKMALALFPGESNKMKVIRAALKNYHYEFFEIRLDGDLSGRIMMTLSASGENPDIKSTTPVELNLQIETQISMLFSSLLKK